MSNEEIESPFWRKAYELYHKNLKDFSKSGKCERKKLNRATFEELRKAFLPKRTRRDVEQVGEKVVGTATELIDNSNLFVYGTPPSCRAIGLDKKGDLEDMYFNKCSLERVKKKPILVCDCPDGYADYTPKQYAEEHVVKCQNNERVWMNYSDQPLGVEKGINQYVTGKSENMVSEMVLGLDKIINAVHGSGPMAHIFVKGGTKTLDRLAQE